MTFQTFTGKDYLKIDIANNFGAGLDKQSWKARIAWFDANEHQLDALLKQAEEPALYYAGMQAWKQVQKGEPSGYPISLDATSSGIQILAALAGDRKAAALCNVVDTGARQDAYTGIYQAMVAKLGEAAKIDRKMTKQAIMTAFYSSTAVPKRIFGEGKLLDVFYQTMMEEAPGAWEINETMLALWNPTWLEYGWVLPDNFTLKIKVMGTVTENVHFLNEPFEVSYNENMTIEGGRSLGANLVHSLDGMICREMARRCMFDPDRINEIADMLARPGGKRLVTHDDRMVETLWQHYLASGFLSARILDHLRIENLGRITVAPIWNLLESLPNWPFEVLMVHDCFRCLPNHGNDLRKQYNNLLAEIAESDMLSFITSQIVGRKISISKLDPTLSRDIRDANYALS